MAARPPDFKASGIRAERIIASGSSTNPRLLLIGSGASGNDGISVNTSDIKLTGTGSDTWLFISGSVGGSDRVTFGGDVFISGTLFGATSGGAAGNSGDVQYNNGSSGFAAESNFNYNQSTNTLNIASLSVSTSLKSDLVPDGDRTRNLGSSANRFANIYTGDLHLRNERGNWTIVEEPDYLCVINNLTGKKYKMMLQPLD
jgi:hypothetical protein